MFDSPNVKRLHLRVIPRVLDGKRAVPSSFNCVDRLIGPICVEESRFETVLMPGAKEGLAFEFDVRDISVGRDERILAVQLRMWYPTQQTLYFYIRQRQEVVLIVLVDMHNGIALLLDADIS